METNERLAYTVDEAAQALSVGTTKIYELLANGELVGRKLGRRTVILREDLEEYAKRLPVY